MSTKIIRFQTSSLTIENVKGQNVPSEVRQRRSEIRGQSVTEASLHLSLKGRGEGDCWLVGLLKHKRIRGDSWRC